MTPRYDLFMAAVAASSAMVTNIFLAAALTLAAYASLEWTPVRIRSAVKRMFEIGVLFFYITVIIIAWSN
jgi:hypothetical protein